MLGADAIGVPHVMAQTIVDLLGVYREMHDIEFTVLAMTNVYGLRQRPDGCPQRSRRGRDGCGRGEGAFGCPRDREKGGAAE